VETQITVKFTLTKTCGAESWQGNWNPSQIT